MTGAFYEVRLNDLMHVALQRGASDIHLVPGVRAAVRVDGNLQYIDGPPISAEETAADAERLLEAVAATRLADYGDTTSTWTGTDKNIVRVHALRTMGGIALALRLLPRTIPGLESLHLPATIKGFCQKTRGLIIFAGPTGSGKSTSLAALVAKINAELPRRIITIEDPIEYRYEGERSVITQREVGRDVPDFASAVLGALRADPDVIMIGEMRDAATMRAAMTAAETGHLVLTTLHTGDAVQTIDRVVDAFHGAEQSQVRAQLSASLVGVVCQRLLPRASGSGRRLAAEVLIATDAVRTIVREARTHQLRNLMLTGRHAGMQTLEHHLSELVADRQIDRVSAFAATERHGELQESVGAAL
jgi:twitching motility protein PilT